MTTATDDAFDKDMTPKALPSSAMTEGDPIFISNRAIPTLLLAGSV